MLFVCVIILFFSFRAHVTYANVSVDQTTYYEFATITQTIEDGDEYTVLFNTDTGAQVYVVGENPGQQPTREIGYLPVGNYSVLSFGNWGQSDVDACTTYAGCKAASDFIVGK